MHQMRLSGDGGEIVIDVCAAAWMRAQRLDRHYPWFDCDVAVQVQPVAARFGIMVDCTEFAAFRDALRALLDRLNGTAAFASFPESQGLTFTVVAKSLGHAEVEGKANSVLRPGTTELSFRFMTDQSFLQGTLKDLDRIVAAYPLL